MRLVFLPLIFSLSASQALALPSQYSRHGWTGNDVLEACASTTNNVESTLCTGYVIGSIEALEFALPHLFCPGKYVTNGQTIDVVVKFLRQFPEKRDNDAPLIIAGALEEAFPCANGYKITK
jgi:hypothetical protein